jgi:hypothetical protein
MPKNESKINKKKLALVLAGILTIGGIGGYLLTTDTEKGNDRVGGNGNGNSGQPSEGYLVVNEFELNPPGRDNDSQWIELYNPTNSKIVLTNWKLMNSDGDEHWLPDKEVRRNGYFRILLNGSWLDNVDEKVFLFNPLFQIIDETPIKADISDDYRTWQRIPNGVDTDSDDDWSFLVTTSGRSNLMKLPQGGLLINEFELNPLGRRYIDFEWIELYNPTDNPINITFWKIENNDGDLHWLPMYEIRRHECFCLSGFDEGWLDNDDEKVILFNPLFQIIDETPVKADISGDNRTWQRIPNGVDTDSDSDWSFSVRTIGKSNLEELPLSSGLLINEFEQNPQGTDKDDEFVELFNPTNSKISLTNWKLENNDGDEYWLPHGWIKRNGYFKIKFKGAWLDNNDEKVILFNPLFQIVDETPIKSDISDDIRTWQRIPNGVDTDSDSDWNFLVETHGSSNLEELPPSSDLLINEFEQNPEGPDGGNEWVELYNPTNSSIDLTNWRLENNDGSKYWFLGEEIKANGYLTITFTGLWLNNSDEKVILIHIDSILDETPIKADSSDDNRTWQRIPNGIDTDSDDDWTFEVSSMGGLNDVQ